MGDGEKCVGMSMNAAQFKRLTLVLALPLFLCGVAFYHIVLPSSGYTTMICWSDGSCREMGYGDRERLESERENYLYIGSPELKARVAFYGYPISIEGKIVHTIPLTGFERDFEAEEIVARRLLGQDAEFLLGYNSDVPSSIYGGDLYLRCNNMSFKQGTEVISAFCDGDGWRQIVHFTPASDHASFFTDLYANMKAADRAKRATEAAIQAATYVSFLLIYGLLSAITAAAIFSYRYVRHGTLWRDVT